MKYNVFKIKFKNDVSQEEIDKIQAEFYKSNENKIDGMICDTLRDKESWDKFNEIYDGFIKKHDPITEQD